MDNENIMWFDNQCEAGFNVTIYSQYINILTEAFKIMDYPTKVKVGLDFKNRAIILKPDNSDAAYKVTVNKTGGTVGRVGCFAVLKQAKRILNFNFDWTKPQKIKCEWDGINKVLIIPLEG